MPTKPNLLNFRMNNNNSLESRQSSFRSIDIDIKETNLLLSCVNLSKEYDIYKTHFEIYDLSFNKIISHYSHVSKYNLISYEQPDKTFFIPYILDEKIADKYISKLDTYNIIKLYNEQFYNTFNYLRKQSKLLYDDTFNLSNQLNILHENYINYVNNYSIDKQQVKSFNEIIIDYYMPNVV